MAHHCHVTGCKRKLSERQAWALLAKVWREEAKLFRSFHSYCFLGLCSSVTMLFYDDRITPVTSDKMRQRINDEQDRLDADSLIWPLTSDGALERALFCERQVRRLTKRKKVTT